MGLSFPSRRIGYRGHGRAPREHLHWLGMRVDVSGAVETVVAVAAPAERPDRGGIGARSAAVAAAIAVPLSGLGSIGSGGRVDGGVGRDGPLLVGRAVVVCEVKVRARVALWDTYKQIIISKSVPQ